MRELLRACFDKKPLILLMEPHEGSIAHSREALLSWLSTGLCMLGQVTPAAKQRA